MGIPTKLFIGNVPSSCHQDELRQLFEQFGTVTECDIIKDYAFVHFEKSEDANTAVETLHETDFQGNVLRVQHSKSSSRNSSMGESVCHHCGTHDNCSGMKPGTKLFIGRLPDGTKSSELQALFEPFGTVTECEVIKDYAFVHFDTRQQARAALDALDEHDLNGSRIHVRMAKSTGEKTREMERERDRGRSWGAGRYDPYDPYGYRGGYGDYGYERRDRRDRDRDSSRRSSSYGGGGSGTPGTKLFVGNLPDDCSNSELRTLFEPYGEITECEIIKDFAFVHFAKPDEAQMALTDLNDTDFGGRTIRVKHSKSGGSGGDRRRADPDGGTADLVKRQVKLFVGNLPRSVDEARLHRLFSRYGPITECQIIKDYAFVHFIQKEHADMALADLNDTEFYGNQIRVKRAQSTGGSADRSSMVPMQPPAPSTYGYSDPYMDSMHSSRYGSSGMTSSARYRPYDVPGDRRRGVAPMASGVGGDPIFDDFLARDPYYSGSSQDRAVRPRV